MISLPFALHRFSYTQADLISALSSFGVTSSASLIVRWNPQISAAEEDNILQKYSQLGQTSALSAGFGYWAKLPAAFSKTLQETVYTSTLSDTIRYDTVQVPLFSGWNQIGNPFQFEIQIKDLKFVSTAGSTTAYSGAASAGLLRDGELYWYRPGSGYVHGPALAGATVTLPTLEPYRGYWLYANQTCTMLIPPYPSALQFGAGFSAPRSAPAALSGRDWAVRFVIRNSRGDVDGQTYAGVSARPARVYKAPSPPSGIWVGIEESGEHFSARYLLTGETVDLRLKIGTDVPGPVTIKIEDIESVPAEVGLTLTDLAAGAGMDLRQSNTYDYHPAEGEFRSFQFSAGAGRAASRAAYPAACLIGRHARAVAFASALRSIRDWMLDGRSGRVLTGWYYQWAAP